MHIFTKQLSLALVGCRELSYERGPPNSDQASWQAARNHNQARLARLSRTGAMQYSADALSRVMDKSCEQQTLWLKPAMART